MFRETCFAVNGLAGCRLEGYCGSFAAVRAFDFKYSFLERVESPRLVLSIIENCVFPIIVDYRACGGLKGFHKHTHFASYC